MTSKPSLPKKLPQVISHDNEPGLATYLEWLDTQYLPAYWIGGKLPPFLLGKRPNNAGYGLVAFGLANLIPCILIFLFVGFSFPVLLISLFFALFMATGIKLLLPEKKQEGNGH
jgi:hypothetical protein